MKRLTRADIVGFTSFYISNEVLLQVEFTGVAAFEELEEIEILFNSVQEIDALQGCSRLQRLSRK